MFKWDKIRASAGIGASLFLISCSADTSVLSEPEVEWRSAEGTWVWEGSLMLSSSPCEFREDRSATTALLGVSLDIGRPGSEGWASASGEYLDETGHCDGIVTRIWRRFGARVRLLADSVQVRGENSPILGGRGVAGVGTGMSVRVVSLTDTVDIVLVRR